MRLAAALQLVPLAAAWACAPAVTVGGTTAAAKTEASARAGNAAGPPDLPPAGLGTLHQDELTVALRSGELLIKVAPLDEAVIRLAAPDAYERLHAAADRYASSPEAISATERPGLVLVSVFSYSAGGAYEPEDLRLEVRGRLLHPQAILPLSAAWGTQQLVQRESRSAVYVFEGPIDWMAPPLAVSYGAARSDDWQRILPRLQAELARVRARAGPVRP